MGDIHSIYAKSYNFVYLRAKSILEKEEDIQQLMKEVYLKAARSTSIREDNMYEWLGRKTYMLGCQKYRKKKAREVEIIELSDEKYRISDGVDKAKTIEVMLGTLEQLPDMYQATLYALYYDHMKIKDIAAIMGYSVGAIINRINYTHKYLEKALEIGQEDIKTKVRFSVEAVYKAMKQWSVDNRLSILTAQNLYSAICKELGVEAEIVCAQDELAGANKQIVECGGNELNAIFRELGTYRTKSFLDKKRLTVLALAGGILVLLILLGVLIFGGSSEEEKKNTPNTEQEAEPDTDADTDVDVDVDAGEDTDVGTDADADGDSDADTEEDAGNDSDTESDVTGGDASEYVLPNSDTVKLTRADLEGLSAEELRIARNELFARYGTIFGAEDLKAHFSSTSWYNPRITFDEFNDSIEMNEVEKANLSLILEVEEEIAQ